MCQPLQGILLGTYWHKIHVLENSSIFTTPSLTCEVVFCVTLPIDASLLVEWIQVVIVLHNGLNEQFSWGSNLSQNWFQQSLKANSYWLDFVRLQSTAVHWVGLWPDSLGYVPKWLFNQAKWFRQEEKSQKTLHPALYGDRAICIGSINKECWNCWTFLHTTSSIFFFLLLRHKWLISFRKAH